MPAGASHGRGFGVDRRIIPVAAQRTWRAPENGSDTRNAHLPGCTRCKHRIGVCGRAPRQAPLDTTCHPPAHAGLSRNRPRPHGPQGDNTSRGGQSQRQGKQSDNGASKAKAKATPAPASSDTGPHGARGRVTHPVARCRNPTLPPAPRRDRPPTCQPHFFKARLGVCREPTKAPRAAGRQPPLQHRNQQPPTHVAPQPRDQPCCPHRPHQPRGHRALAAHPHTPTARHQPTLVCRESDKAPRAAGR